MTLHTWSYNACLAGASRTCDECGDASLFPDSSRHSLSKEYLLVAYSCSFAMAMLYAAETCISGSVFLYVLVFPIAARLQTSRIPSNDAEVAADNMSIEL